MQKIPFGYIEGGQFNVFTHDGLTELGPDWSGVCNGKKTTDFWYLGKDPVNGERSYSRLQSHNYASALNEAGAFEQQQRLRAGTATVQSFVQAVDEMFHGDPSPVFGKHGRFAPTTSAEVLSYTQEPKPLVQAKQADLAALRTRMVQLHERAALQEVGIEEWAAYGTAQDEAVNAFADELVYSKTFCGMSAESATQRWVLSPSAQTPGAWRITTFSPKDNPWGHVEIGDKRKAIVRLLEVSDFQNVQPYYAPIKESDAACVIQDTMYFMVDKIPAGKEIPVLMRELCKRNVDLVVGQDEMSNLVTQLKGWESAPASSTESRVYHEATRRASLFYGPEHDQHLFAYAVEEAVSMGIQPNTMAPKGSADEWLAKVESVAHRFYTSLSAHGPALEPQDLVDFAYAMAQIDSPEVGCDVRRVLREAREAVISPSALVGKNVLGYYITEMDAGGFHAEVRDQAGAVVLEVLGGRNLPQREASLVDFGFMSNWVDLDGLQAYMQDTGMVGGDTVVLLPEDFERELQARAAPAAQRDSSMTLG
jgi:hypothetical protein